LGRAYGNGLIAQLLRQRCAPLSPAEKDSFGDLHRPSKGWQIEAKKQKSKKKPLFRGQTLQKVAQKI